MERRVVKSMVVKNRRNGRAMAQAQPAASYLALIHSWPLRPIRTERDYERAIAQLDELAVRPEGSLDAGEQDYLDTLTMLVEAYEQVHVELQAAQDDPLATLRYLMDESGMSQADLGPAIGESRIGVIDPAWSSGPEQVAHPQIGGALQSVARPTFVTFQGR
jgi:antitoxin component HigA of HigAB toxin-antitoxin module